MRQLIERSFPSLAVLSYNEIPRRAMLEITAQIPAAALGAEAAVRTPAAAQV
jgi:hypothetical protein